MLVSGELADDTPTSWPKLGPVYEQLRSNAYAGLLTDRDDAGTKPKQLCAVGAVARAEIEWDNDARRGPWTGCLGGKSSGEGILRLSSAIAPPLASGGEGSGSGLPSALKAGVGLFAGSLRKARLFPCAAFKIPRGGGQPSANVLFGGRKTGHESNEFFHAALATSMTEKAAAMLSPLMHHFRKYSDYPTHMGISDLAVSDSEGHVTPEVEVKFPWCLVLIPTREAAALAVPPPVASDATAKDGGGVPRSAMARDDFLRQLQRLPAGTALYDVYAIGSPEEALPKRVEEGGLRHVGKLVSRSRFIRSAADAGLKFWHQKKEEDYARRPEWRKALTDHHRSHCGAEFFAAVIRSPSHR